MKRIIFIIYILIIVSILYSQDESKHKFWGDSGYILEADREREGFEGQIPGKKDKDKVDEYKRWLFKQTIFFSFNYRYLNIIEVGNEIGLNFRTLEDLKNTIPYNLIKQLYVKANPALWVSLNFGKQRLKWGTSSIFYPIDKLEVTPDPLGVRKVPEGVLGIKATFIPTDWFSIQLVTLPDLEMRYTKFAARIEFTIAYTDIGFGGIKYDVPMMKSVNEEKGKYKTERLHRGAFFFDIVKYFGNFGLMGDFELRFSREKEYALLDKKRGYYKFSYGDGYRLYPVFRASAGINYKMDILPFMDFSLEYFYNSEGFNWQEAQDFYKNYKYHKDQLNKEDTNLQMILPQSFGKFGSFRQHYISVIFSNIAFLNFFSFKLGLICNIETLSFNFTHGFTFNIKKYIYISFTHDFYKQFLDSNEYPSDLNFLDIDHRISISVTGYFSK